MTREYVTHMRSRTIDETEREKIIKRSSIKPVYQNTPTHEAEWLESQGDQIYRCRRISSLYYTKTPVNKG